MYWNSTTTQLPEEGETVLVQKGEVIDFARYNADEGRFVLRNGDSYHITEDLQWMELVRQSPFLKL